MEAYRRMDVDSVTQAFSEDMKNKTGRNINKQFIKNTVWNLIENRFKNGVQ
jgi:hypothetical protein